MLWAGVEQRYFYLLLNFMKERKAEISMEFEEVIKKRRSIRNFEETPVPKEIIEELLTAASLAPSATNRQPWRFMVVSDGDTINHLGEAVMQPFVTGAPVIIVCCIDKRAFTKNMVKERVEELVAAGVVNREVANMLYKRKLPQRAEEAGIPVSAYIDIGISVEHMVLSAANRGLGTCWVRMFDSERVCSILKLEEELFPVALLPLGYPAENPPAIPRLSTNEIVIKPN